jgi:hypothetical protein
MPKLLVPLVGRSICPIGVGYRMDIFLYIAGADSCLFRVKFHYNLRGNGQQFLFGRDVIGTGCGIDPCGPGGVAVGNKANGVGGIYVISDAGGVGAGDIIAGGAINSVFMCVSLSGNWV